MVNLCFLKSGLITYFSYCFFEYLIHFCNKIVGPPKGFGRSICEAQRMPKLLVKQPLGFRDYTCSITKTHAHE